MKAQRIGALVVVVALAAGATTVAGREVLSALGDAAEAFWAWLSDQLQRIDVGRVGTSRAGLAILFGASTAALVVTIAAAFRAAITGRVLATAYVAGVAVGVLLYARGLA